MGERRSPWPGAAQVLLVSQKAVGAHRRGPRNWGAAGAGLVAGTRLWTLGKCHWAGVPSTATAGRTRVGRAGTTQRLSQRKKQGSCPGALHPGVAWEHLGLAAAPANQPPVLSPVPF